jgi:hypothetical protein
MNFVKYNFIFIFILFFSKQQDFTQHKRNRKLVKYNFGFPSQPELMGDSAAFIFVWSCDPVMFRFLSFFFGSISTSKIQKKYSAKKFLAFLQNLTTFSRKKITRKICHILTQVLIFGSFLHFEFIVFFLGSFFHQIST